MAIKHPTPLLDQLETGPWPSFVSDIKQEAEYRAANPDNVEFQVPADAPDDLLGVLELSYKEGETHWKHGGIVGVFGYGGGVIGPTFLEIDILLSFNTIIKFPFTCDALFNASYAMPPVKAPSPITEITL